MSSTRLKWTSTSIPFAQNKPLQVMIFIFIIFFGLMALSPTDRKQWLADSLPLVVIILILAFTYKRFHFSTLSYFLMFVFFCLTYLCDSLYL